MLRERLLHEAKHGVRSILASESLKIGQDMVCRDETIAISPEIPEQVGCKLNLLLPLGKDGLAINEVAITYTPSIFLSFGRGHALFCLGAVRKPATRRRKYVVEASNAEAAVKIL